MSALDCDRNALKVTLGDDYNYLDAHCCEKALDVLSKGEPLVSAAIVDISTDDGLNLLSALAQNKHCEHIPVIAVTAENECRGLEEAYRLGATAHTSRPYSQAIIRPMLDNILRLAESSQRKTITVPQSDTAPVSGLASYRGSVPNKDDGDVKRDKVTGLIARDVFSQRASEIICRSDPCQYVLSCYNIENFKIINDQYGMDKGDAVLRFVGECINRYMEQIGGICCRYTSDRFATVYPAEHMDTELLTECHRKAQMPDCINRKITIRVGRYIIEDKNLPVGNMYDRAAIAEESIHGKYDVFVADFKESMRVKLLEEQQIIADMHDALRSEQFETWLQPQYNHATGALIGAEALVRWRKPTDGSIIPPSLFIPVFERNGFIYELDKYVWEQVCKLIRRWLDEGKSPLPISVNISRYDVLMPDFINVLTGLVEKYRIDPELLRLEITETAFTHSTDAILSVFKKLIALGFTVEIDDFGSGYSSLNTLKDMPANILKLDMKFLQNSEESKRGGIILESVVRMARWLDMTVIAEGVETVEQAEYLRSIGCLYVQGYLYAKPMPVPDYEALVRESVKTMTFRPNMLTHLANLENNRFWDPKSMDTLIFNSYIGGACIIEAHNGRLELLRANDKYVRILGSAGMTVTDALKLEWTSYMDAEGKAELFAAMRRSIETGDEVTSEFVFYSLPGCAEKTYLRITLRVIAYSGERLLVYCTLENVTELRLAEAERNAAERRHRAAAKQLRAIIDNVNGGVAAMIFNQDRTEYIFTNDEFYSMLGYTREQFAEEVSGGILNLINPEDLPEVLSVINESERTGIRTSVEYRVRRRDGREIWVYGRNSVCYLEDIGKPVYISIIIDITEQKETAEQFRFLNAMAHDILAQPDIEEGIYGMLHRLREFFGSSRVYIMEFDCDERQLVNTYGVTARGKHQLPPELRKVSVDTVSYWFDRYLDREYIEIDDIELLPDANTEKHTMRAMGIKSIVIVPLRRNEKIIGFIGLENNRRNQAHFSRLVALGDYIAVMLTRRDYEKRLSEHAFELEQIMDGFPGGYAKMRVTDTGIYPVYINDEFCRMCAMSRKELIELYSKDSYAGVHPDDMQSALETIKSAKENGSTEIVTLRFRRGDGEYVPVQALYRVTQDIEGDLYLYGYYSEVPPKIES